jgi:hypothetical protein
MPHIILVIIVRTTGEEKERKGDKEKSSDLFDHNKMVLDPEGIIAKSVPEKGITFLIYQ